MRRQDSNQYLQFSKHCTRAIGLNFLRRLGRWDKKGFYHYAGLLLKLFVKEFHRRWL